MKSYLSETVQTTEGAQVINIEIEGRGGERYQPFDYGPTRGGPTADLPKSPQKPPNFWTVPKAAPPQSGASPTSMRSHFPPGIRAPRPVSLRHSCSWAARRAGCCSGSRRTTTERASLRIQPWQLRIA
jgi:hypothetical protein